MPSGFGMGEQQDCMDLPVQIHSYSAWTRLSGFIPHLFNPYEGYRQLHELALSIRAPRLARAAPRGVLENTGGGEGVSGGLPLLVVALANLRASSWRKRCQTPL